ncbi:MAG: hypothetical protein QM500_17490 [Methylococcales bacterium]
MSNNDYIYHTEGIKGIYSMQASIDSPMKQVFSEADKIWELGFVVMPIFDPKGTKESWRVILEIWVLKAEESLKQLTSKEGESSQVIKNIADSIQNAKKQIIETSCN